ncbi:uncharacterized protein MYCFIDRAFT_85508 [Pseudocercospora fijiensis CIRAD86]|uniref:Uncharacterized protein n=1 Tax=Pseudocercospora fijiensis (strain CIRAD86) TaxID=383855 RepID=M3B2T3_PSEFD|nr:uncharacterized protein MYCFIDRAFT_85508 [Pseudocercospora fijiensis CIRAD86]EME83673.1 hypothetical protein MYCFIDRAFT_85508 [Pseudocercospora fijiensis CIRAD86]
MTPKPYFNSKGEVLSLIDYMGVKRISDWTYESTTKAYEPTGGANGAYGGFFYALSAWDSSPNHLTKSNHPPHKRNFILGGIPSEHFTLNITKLGDGGSELTAPAP